MKRLEFRQLVRTATGIVVLSMAGCQSVSPKLAELAPWSSKPKLVESEYEEPVRMAAMWTTDLFTQPGERPTRGFGGRLYFYDSHSQSIPVEGQLVVYAYDDTSLGGSNAGQTPIRKFAFTPDQFTHYLSDSELGASYSVWLPWDAVGGEQKSVSLVPVFTSTSGNIVMGEQATSVLPGRPGSPNEALAFKTASREARLHGRPGSLMNYQTTPSQQIAKPESQEVAPAHGLKTTTIDLPIATQRRLITATDLPRRSIEQQSRPIMAKAVADPAAALAVSPIMANPAGSTMAAAVPQGSVQPASRFAPNQFPARASLGGQSSPSGPGSPQHLIAQPSGHLLSRPPARQSTLGLADEPNATRFRR